MGQAILEKQTSCCICFTSCWNMTKSTFFQETSTKTNIRSFYGTLPQESTPKLITRSSRRQGMRLFHLKSFRWTTKRLLSLTTWFVKAAKTPSSTISSTGGTKTAALFISLVPFTRYQKRSATTVGTFAFLHFFRKKTSESRASLGWITNSWTAQPTKNIPSFTMTNHRY